MVYEKYGVCSIQSKNQSETHFPHNIYKAEVVQPLPYFTRDIINPAQHFEYTKNVLS